MRKQIIILIILIAFLGILYFISKNEAVAPVITSEENVEFTSEEERTAVEDFVKENIVTLSPVPAVMGGTWYVVSMEVDPEANSGEVTYEDGHIQEKRAFTYSVNANGKVESVTIK